MCFTEPVCFTGAMCFTEPVCFTEAVCSLKLCHGASLFHCSSVCSLTPCHDYDCLGFRTPRAAAKVDLLVKEFTFQKSRTVAAMKAMNEHVRFAGTPRNFRCRNVVLFESLTWRSLTCPW